MTLNFDVILTAVRDAIKLCERVQADGFDASSKSDDSPVTIADYGVQAIICRAIQQHFPDHRVIGEEGGATFRKLVQSASQQRVTGLIADIIGVPVTVEEVMNWLDAGRDVSASRYTWVIDPIDGTRGFVAGIHYAVCVALLDEYQPVAGVIAFPHSPIDANGSLVYAVDGNLYVQSLTGENARTGSVSDRTAPETLVVMESPNEGEARTARAHLVRAAVGVQPSQVEYYNSQLKYALIAMGYGDQFMRLPRRDPHLIWDHAPGTALVVAGGGRVTGVDGELLDFSQGDALPNAGMIASNGAVHDELVAAIQTMVSGE